MKKEYYFLVIALCILIIVVAISPYIYPKLPEPADTLVVLPPPLNTEIIAQIIEPQGRKITSTSTNPLPSDTPYFTSPKNYFRFKQKSDWTEAPVVLPEGLTGTQFALQKNGSSCVFSYIETDSEWFSRFTQTSFSNRIMTSKSQFDPSWYVLKKYTPSNFVFDWDKKQSLQYEIWIAHTHVFPSNKQLNGLFIIYTTDSSIVSNECVDDVSAMLATYEIEVQDTTLTNSSNGKLFLYYAEQQQSLFFLNTNSQIIQEVMPLIDIDYRPTVFNNLIFVTQKGIPKTLDVTTKQLLPLQDFKLSPGESVIDFSIYKDRFFYLTGSSTCEEYRASCELALSEYNLLNHSIKLIREKVRARNIVGYDPIKDTLPMYWSEGDAGCFWASSFEYDFRLGTTTISEKYAGCASESDIVDPSYEKNSQAFSAFLKQNNAYSTSTNYILINNGKLSLPVDHMDLPVTSNPFKFVY